MEGRIAEGNGNSLFRYVDLVEVTFPISFGDDDIFMSLSKQSFGESQRDGGSGRYHIAMDSKTSGSTLSVDLVDDG